MPDTDEQHWLLDTNIIIDLLVGLVCYTVHTVLVKVDKNAERYCSNIFVRSSIIEKAKAIASTLSASNIEKQLQVLLERITNSLNNEGVKLVVSDKTKKETLDVIKKLLELESKYQKQYNRPEIHIMLLPVDYLIDYDYIVRKLLDLFEPIDTDKLYEQSIQVIEKHLKGRYDREDWHLVAALLKDSDIKAIYTEEDSVAIGLRRIAKHYRNNEKIAIGGFDQLIANLRALNVVSLKEASLISYYAYKFQRLLHSHNKVYEAGRSACRENSRLIDLLLWISYSQRRLQHYIPIEKILRKQSA